MSLKCDESDCDYDSMIQNEHDKRKQIYWKLVHQFMTDHFLMRAEE